MQRRTWRSYAYEFFTIFIAVIAAFSLNNWNMNRRNHNAEQQILKEINNGLMADLSDVKINMMGHKVGIEACTYWRRFLNGATCGQDSTLPFYFNLTRDYICIQNISGYESLKSKGLELIQDDSLRYEIISLYEYHFTSLRKFEENYTEAQFHESYFSDLNAIIAPALVFDTQGEIIGLQKPSKLSPAQKNIALSQLWKIKANREFILTFYQDLEAQIKGVQQRLEQHLR